MRDVVSSGGPHLARLRARNQLTLPDRVATQLDAREGDRFVVLVEGPDSVRLIRMRERYAGALRGIWGASQEAADGWLREERRAWRRREDLYDPDGSAGG